MIRAPAARRRRPALHRLGGAFLQAFPAIFLGAALWLPVRSVPAEPLDVAADIAPVNSLVAQVMEGTGTPKLLLKAGSDPHHVQLRPSQIRLLRDARLIFRVGPELTPWLDEALARLGAGEKTVALLHVPGTRLLQGDGAHSRAPAHALAQHAGEDSAGSRAAGTDPHAWLDPRNGALWLGVIAHELAARDPAHAGAYHANAIRAKARLAALETRMTARLAPLRGMGVIVSHDGYAYFATHFGIRILGAIETGSGAPPGAARIRKLRRLAGSGDVACILAEQGRNPARARVVAEGSGLPVITLPDPAAGSLPTGPRLYAALLEGLADAFARCGGKDGLAE